MSNPEWPDKKELPNKPINMYTDEYWLGWNCAIDVFMRVINSNEHFELPTVHKQGDFSEPIVGGHMESVECEHEWGNFSLHSMTCQKCGKVEPNLGLCHGWNKCDKNEDTVIPHIKGDFSEPIVGGHFEDNEVHSESEILFIRLQELKNSGNFSPLDIATCLVSEGYRKEPKNESQ